MMTNGLPSKEHGKTGSVARSHTDVPRLVDGVQLLGEYQGSGYQESRFLVYRPDEQAILLTPLLYRLLVGMDGRRDLAELADLVSAGQERTVDADGVRYLVERKLEPLGLVVLHAPAEAVPVADPLLTLSARGVLLPARVVRIIARLLAPLHLPPVVVATFGTLLALDAWMFTSGHTDAAFRETVADPAFMLLTVALLLASALFHECGHAAGCHYGGARPGAIGVGLYVVFPCFYTNVTDAYRLNKIGRLRTDLGGIYFNGIFIVVLGCTYLMTDYPPLLAAAVLVHAQILQQLLPTLRMDGYYIVADLVGVPNLFGLIAPVVNDLLPGRGGRHTRRTDTNLRPVVRRVVTGWVLMVIPFLVGGLILMVMRAPTYLGIAWSESAARAVAAGEDAAHGAVAGVALQVVSIIMLWLPWVGIGLLLVRILSRLAKAVAGTGRRRTKTAQPTAP
jgi:putative peptide zinc metalloprotease protein